MDTPIKLVALYRISEDKKGKNKKSKNYVPNTLGMQAQKIMVHQAFPKPRYTIVKEFYERRSGRKKNRPVLNEVLDYCRETKCVLVVARQDRLTRRFIVVAALLESNIDYRVSLYPELDPKKNLMIFLMQAIIDQLESMTLSQRVEAAIHVKLDHGGVMGQYGKNVLSKRNHEKSLAFSLSKTKVLTKLVNVNGVTSYNGLAKALNKLKEPTYFDDGRLWSAKTVRHVIGIIERETGRKLVKSKKRTILKTHKK